MVLLDVNSGVVGGPQSNLAISHGGPAKDDICN